MRLFRVLLHTTRGNRVFDGVRADSKPAAERIAESMLRSRGGEHNTSCIVLDATVLEIGA